MDREKRLKEIISILSKGSVPVSGNKIAAILGVTRQVVVQDIVVLKSLEFKIISTARGYLLNAKIPCFTRLFAVRHTKDEIEKELTLIVENGGEVLDVIIEHPVYGEIKGNLDIKTLEDIKVFMSAMKTSNAEPLLLLSNGIHLHTIGSESEEVLAKIDEELKKAGFLI